MIMMMNIIMISGSSVFLLLINSFPCEQLGCEYLLIAGCYKGARVC